MTVEERFWSHVDRRGDDECWDWTGPLKDGRYGSFTVDGQGVRVHRWAYTYFIGDPGELEVRHSCNRPICVNFLAHLSPGTHTDNMRDMVEAGRSHQSRGRCIGKKLTTEQVIEIRTLYTGAIGEQAALARHYGVGPPTIHKILRGKTW